jgi:hypothetical protein
MMSSVRTLMNATNFIVNGRVGRGREPADARLAVSASSADQPDGYAFHGYVGGAS